MRFVAMIVSLALFAALADGASATTGPESVYGVHVTLTDSTVIFAPHPLTADTDITFFLTVTNKGTSTRWFRFSGIRTPLLAPGKKLSFFYSFSRPGYVTWTSGGKGATVVAGKLRVRRAPALPDMGVPGFNG